MTDLTICRVFDERFVCRWILADHVCGAGFNACPATDTPPDRLDGHLFFPLLIHTDLFFYFSWMELWQWGREPAVKKM
jgi:hypothetical protein